MFFLFSGVPFGFISRVRIRNNFIQGAGVVAIIILISITLRSMGSFTQVYFNERKVMLKLQFILGAVKNRLGSSIAYYQAQQQNFWAFQEAWVQTPKASPLPKLVKMANFADF